MMPCVLQLVHLVPIDNEVVLLSSSPFNVILEYSSLSSKYEMQNVLR
jgi:hypothetical protein